MLKKTTDLVTLTSNEIHNITRTSTEQSRTKQHTTRALQKS